ncbi:MAG: MFS transporter [Anaerolineae bacterium]
MKRILAKLALDPTIWSRNLIVLAITVFLNQFGQGVLGGARTNFFVDVMHLTGNQVLWLEGIREIPGLALIFIAAFTMRLPLSRSAAWSIFLMGIGYGLFAFVHSYTALLVVAVIASLGIHVWMPIHSALSMSLSTKDKTGHVMGILSSVGALASIVGMAVLTLISKLGAAIPLTAYYIAGAIFIIIAALLTLKLPTNIGSTEREPPRMLLKRRYWLYYVSTFFQGSRKEVLNTFGILVLVQNFGLEVWHVSLLLLTSGIVNLVGAPYLGRLLDKFGERVTVSTSYILLTLCCVGFAMVNNVWLLVLLLLTVKLLVMLGMGLNTYVYRSAPAEELTPTLSAGISINHVTSVAMPLVAGALLPLIGYEGIFLGTAGLILLSVPFALGLRTEPQRVPQTVPVSAE